MMLRKFVLLAVLVVIFSCKGDNDDIIEPNDVINIDLTQGIVFGSINPANTSENNVYSYTNEGIFLVTNAETITTEMLWTTTACPYAKESLTSEFTDGIPNVARGIRDISSTDIAEKFAEGEQFYILEYVTSGNTKTIQFTEEQSFNEEQINTYLSYIKKNLLLIGNASGDSPLPDCTL